MPRVSVIIPTFNLAPFLGRAIDSVLAQTYRDYEIILVDDGSTDETREVAAQFAGKMKFFCQTNQGPTRARNFALSKASGELIAYLDADDMWFPDKLEEQVAYLGEHKKCGVVHSDVTIIDDRDQVIHHQFNQHSKRQAPQGNCMTDLLYRHNSQLSTVLVRRECLAKTGGFDERVRGASDYLQWILMVMDGMAVGYIDRPLVMYRWREGSMQTNGRQMLEDMVMMFEILLEEKSIALRSGEQAADIVRSRLCVLQSQLAYLDRSEGRMAEARRRVFRLLRGWPLKSSLYVELLKTCVPAALQSRLRSFREKWA